MDFKKKVIILSGLIAVLIISYSLGTYYSASNVASRRIKELFFDNAKRNEIASVIIDGMKADMKVGDFTVESDYYVELKKVDNDWFVVIDGVKYLSDNSNVESMFDSIFNLNKNQLAGRSRASWNQFEIGEGQYRKISLLDKNDQLIYALYHGKEGPAGGRGEYIRTSLSDEVYLTDGSIIRFFIRDADYWSYVRLLPEEVTSETIMSVKIDADLFLNNNYYIGNIHIARNTEPESFGWKNLAGSGAVDERDAENLANNIALLTGKSFAPDVAIDHSNAVIEIETSNLGRFFIDVQFKSGKLYTKRRGGEYTYEIENYKIERIISIINDLSTGSGY